MKLWTAVYLKPEFQQLCNGVKWVYTRRSLENETDRVSKRLCISKRPSTLSWCTILWPHSMAMARRVWPRAPTSTCGRRAITRKIRGCQCPWDYADIVPRSCGRPLSQMLIERKLELRLVGHVKQAYHRRTVPISIKEGLSLREIPTHARPREP
jgi:hypothetical protein